MTSFSFHRKKLPLLRTARASVCAFIALFASKASGVTYVKAGAPEGGDGLSWDSAFRTIEAGVTDAAVKDGVLYIASGLYPVAQAMVIPDGMEIYGGFQGLSSEETPGDRLPGPPQTILSGDLDRNDHWVHVVPEERRYGFKTEDLPEEPLLFTDRINVPPPYTGGYDAYYPRIKGENGEQAFLVKSDAGALFDGLTFIGFKVPRPYGACIDIEKGARGVQVRDCLFIGNHVHSGQVNDRSGKAVISGCRFLHSKGGCGTAVFMSGGTTVENCHFESLVREGSICDGGVLHFNDGKARQMVRRCVFTHCGDQSNGKEVESWHGGGGAIVANNWGAGMMVDCIVSNCFSMSPGATGIPLVNLRDSSVVGSSFIDNRYAVKPAPYHSYALFGAPTTRRKNTVTYEGCLFRGNTISAPSVATEEGDFALGIVGVPSGEGNVSVVNCTFDSNSAECVEVDGISSVRSRALLCTATGQEYVRGLGVANCTFSGPSEAGLYDIVQYGASHESPLKVVNSLFMADGLLHYQPFHVEVPGMFAVYDCTIGDLSPMEYGFPMAGLRTDCVPFLREGEALVGQVPVLLPAAKAPGLRETADVARNETADFYTTFRFRPRGGTAWEPLLPAAGTAIVAGGETITDANGHPRPLGAFTRGASQPLAPVAESGVTLVVRREPMAGGRLSVPATQSVESGTAITPVTAFPSEGAFFDGWYGEDGALLSSDPVLAIGALEEDRVLTARFRLASVKIVFDLGAGGYFKENGRSVISVTVQGGDRFPAIPPYIESEEWHVMQWDRELPAFVPAFDSSYHAELVSKRPRIVRVVPGDEVPADSDRTGSSWRNATDDLAWAYRTASTYRGEVWLKEGTYPITNALLFKSNVAIRGGFAGTEATSSEADPEGHPTILTGDLAGDNFWKPEGIKDVPLAERMAVWSGGAFATPNPDGADRFWFPGGNNNDDAPGFLCTGPGTATNGLLEGITLTGFKGAAIRLDSGAPSLKVRGCRFLANATGLGWQATGVLFLKRGTIECEDCEFTGNHLVAWIAPITREAPSVFRRCHFQDNASQGTTACLHTRDEGELLVEDCAFSRNSVYLEHWGSASVLNLESKRPSVMRDCLLSGNRTYDTAYGAIRINSSSPGQIIVERCRFVGNEATTSEGSHSPCIVVSAANHFLVRDSYFEGNRLDARQISTGSVAGSVLAQLVKGKATTTLLNCTLLGNECRNGSAVKAAAGTFATSAEAGFALVHGLVDGSRFSGPASEFAISTPAGLDATVAVFNSIVHNEGNGYQAFSLASPSFGLALANSAISGIDPESLARDRDGYRYEVSSDCGPLSSLKSGPRGVRAKGVAGRSDLARKGRPVWFAADGDLYFHDPEANPLKPWRKIVSKSSYVAQVEGLSLESPLVADAFGRARRRGKVAYGPLNGPGLATCVMVR